MPRLTRKPWFGPKRLIGWGWAPASWQGWLVMAVFLVAVAAVAVFLTGTARALAAVALLVILLLTTYLTGEPPGPPGRSE
jgi:hypothetical protein